MSCTMRTVVRIFELFDRNLGEIVTEIENIQTVYERPICVCIEK